MERTYRQTPGSAQSAVVGPRENRSQRSVRTVRRKIFPILYFATNAGKDWADVGFTAEQECPQCGAPIVLEETDHLLLCPYCNVNSFLSAPDYFRFVLPHKVLNKDLIYVPYLRFRGCVYFCSERGTGHRIVDITRLGVPFKKFPISLGLRPQAVKMRFVAPDTEDTFLKCFLTKTELLNRAAKHSS